MLYVRLNSLMRPGLIYFYTSWLLLSDTDPAGIFLWPLLRYWIFCALTIECKGSIFCSHLTVYVLLPYLIFLWGYFLWTGTWIGELSLTAVVFHLWCFIPYVLLYWYLLITSEYPELVWWYHILWSLFWFRTCLLYPTDYSVW